MTAWAELADAASRVPFLVWALLVGLFVLAALALVAVTRNERPRR